MNNPEKLGTQGKQNEEKQKHNIICVRPQSLEVSKIRGKNKKNFEKFWSSMINKMTKFFEVFLIFSLIFETSSDCEWTPLYVNKHKQN